MCACNNKQMYTIKKMVHTIDPKAFTIIVESNEVVGEGFKEKFRILNCKIKKCMVKCERPYTFFYL